MDDSFSDLEDPYCPNSYMKLMKSALTKDKKEEKVQLVDLVKEGVEEVSQRRVVDEEAILSDDSHEEARYVTRARKKMTKTNRTAKLKKKLRPPPPVLIDCVSSDEESQLEQEIKVIWDHRLDKLHLFYLKKHERLSVIVEKLSRIYRTSFDQISLVLNKKQVSPQDTVGSLNINITNYLEAGIRNQSSLTSIQDENSKLEIKCISADAKKPFVFHVFPSQPLQIIFDYLKLQELSNGTKLRTKKLKLIFDGDEVKPEDTAEELGLEGGECFDLYVS